jgi:cytochrome P450
MGDSANAERPDKRSTGATSGVAEQARCPAGSASLAPSDVSCPVAGLTFQEAALQYDPFDARYQGKDLMPFYKRIREELPVFKAASRDGYWIVSRYKDVAYVLRHPEIFSARRILFPYVQDETRLPLNLDPPEQHGYHKVLMKVFSRERVKEMEPTTTQVVKEVLATLDGPTCEFVSMFAMPVVIGIVLRNIGLPEPFIGRLLEVVKFREGGPAGLEAGLEVKQAFEADVAAWTISRRNANGGGALTQLANSELGGRPLTDEEIGRMANLVVGGSIDTSVTTLSNSMAWLAEHPEDRRKLMDNPPLYAAVADEILRYQPLVANGRVVVRETELGGQRMTPGDRVMMLWQVTGRDPAMFTDPDEMQFGRSPNPHLGFGTGVHLCIGQHLARSLIRIALEGWHGRFRDYRVPADQPPVRRIGFISGVRRLDLELS